MPRRRRVSEHARLKPSLDRFADDTSMLGFRYLHTRYKTWFRVLWALVLFFFLGLTVYQVCERISYYFIRNPLTTRRSYDTPKSMNFPIIGICNKMQLKASSVAAMDATLLTAMCRAHSNDGQVTTNLTILNSLNKFNKVDILKMYKEGQQTIEDLFISCQLGKMGSCMEDIRPFYTPNGLCFAVQPNITVRRPGPETTLSLLLNLEVYDIIPGMVVDPGVMVSISESGGSFSYPEGIHLEAGKVVTIPINEVRKLTRYNRHCGRMDLGAFAKSEYSLAACQWTKLMFRVENECGCIPIASPHHRSFLGRDTLNYSESRRKSKTKLCTLRQELECVNYWVPSEIESLLPSDWEDDKEKRMNTFQKALDAIPNELIPVVRSVQQLASEIQQFFSFANQVFHFDSNDTSIVCFSSKGVKLLDLAFHQLKSQEPVWEAVTTYVQHSLAHELNSTAQAVGVEILSDGSAKLRTEFEYNSSMIFLSLLQLGLIQKNLNQPEGSFGLRQMNEPTRSAVVKHVLSLIELMRHCVTKLHDDRQNSKGIANECASIFLSQYSFIFQGKEIYSNLESGKPAYKEYEKAMTKIVSALRKVTKDQRVKMLDWNNFDIPLKQFEAFYRDGGKDFEEIYELMKLRKLLLADIMDVIKSLSNFLEKLLRDREEFLQKFGLSRSKDPISGIKETLRCLKKVHDQVPLLKKNAFVRGEWLNRLSQQLEVAQSYSSSPKYDQVNLLHIKLYFAHFKQETIVQDRSYNVFLLLAEIGGTIGLYVGATLLTAAETVVFFFEKNTRNFILKKEEINRPAKKRHTTVVIKPTLV